LLPSLLRETLSGDVFILSVFSTSFISSWASVLGLVLVPQPILVVVLVGRSYRLGLPVSCVLGAARRASGEGFAQFFFLTWCGGVSL